MSNPFNFGDEGRKKPSGGGRASQPCLQQFKTQGAVRSLPAGGWIGPFMEQAGAGSAGGDLERPPYPHQQMHWFVCGRDLEEADHPGDCSDEALPALRLTPSAANVLHQCRLLSAPKITTSVMPAVVLSALLAKSDVTLEYLSFPITVWSGRLVLCPRCLPRSTCRTGQPGV